MNAEWLVVVNADGTILAVDGAPADWIGTRLRERADASAPRIRVVPLHAIPVHRRPTDLRALLTSIVDVMAPQARAIDASLRLAADPNLPTMLLDTEKIAWSLTALIGNSLRFVRRGSSVRPGGTISVRASHVPASSDVVLEVADDGVGIPADRLSQLLKRPSDGSGASALALNLVQDIVAAHGGSVHIESSTEAWHSGTTVRLTIPSR
jgi:signal transduction histidine kinase